MKSLKTPLRYPGGKSRAAQKIEAYFPDLGEYDEFREPFIGGGSVAHAGTFGGNGVSMAAANAVLDILAEEPVLKELSIRGHKLKEGLDKVLSEANLPHQMCGHPNIQGFLITENKVEEVRDLQHSDDEMYEKIMDNMFQRGVWAENDPREPWFLCASHSDEIIDETLNIFQDWHRR